MYIKAIDDVDDGDIAVVLVDDEATLKQVYHLPNGLKLYSINPEYLPMEKTFDDYSVIRILGVPVGFTRMYRKGRGR